MIETPIGGRQRRAHRHRRARTREIIVAFGLAIVSVGALAQNEGATPRSAAPLFSEQDLMFLQHMIVHHAQALDMSALVPARTERAEFIRFADFVRRAQAAEIEQMQSLLNLAEARGLVLPSHVMSGDPPMSGMLSSAQMRRLEQTRGDEFVRLWLEGMIYHHQGAIDMAFEQQLHQLDTKRRPFGLSVLVEDILVEQRAEITKMRMWLEEWGLTGDP